MNKEALQEASVLLNKWWTEQQDNIEEYFGEDCYKLKTDDELMNKIGDFGFGELEFHTADVERLRTEKEFWRNKYLELLSLEFNKLDANSVNSDQEVKE
jgi:hypothetical protein